MSTQSQYQTLARQYLRQIDKTAIDTLPPFESHGRKIILVNDHNLDLAVHDLMQARYVGFDTESKPTFRKGEKSTGIALIQICTHETCYLFQMRHISDITPMGKIIGHAKIIKIGVGLRDDLTKLRELFKCQPESIVDLSKIFRSFGRKNSIGSKQLVALVLKKRLRKSKRATTSNWAVDTLSPMQIQYAADDAFSSVDVYLKLREVFASCAKFMDRNAMRMLDLEA